MQGAHPPHIKRVSQVLDVNIEQAGPLEGSKMDQRLVLLRHSMLAFQPSCPASAAVVHRRLERKQRQAEWAAFLDGKPDANTEHPDDLAAIAAAKAGMGDYKLRSDPASAESKVLKSG